MTITQQPTASPDVEEAWKLYETIFTEINSLAAQRHLMTFDEFATVYHHPDVLKFYAYQDDTAVGMSVLTRELEAWPLISPEYFARRWPDLHVRKAIWYVGFVGVAPNHSYSFRELVSAMYAPVIASRGVAVMDFCGHNMSHRRLPEVTLTLLGRLNPAAGMEIADTQTFVLYDFGHKSGGA